MDDFINFSKGHGEVNLGSNFENGINPLSRVSNYSLGCREQQYNIILFTMCQYNNKEIIRKRSSQNTFVQNIDLDFSKTITAID